MKLVICKILFLLSLLLVFLIGNVGYVFAEDPLDIPNQPALVLSESIPRHNIRWNYADPSTFGYELTLKKLIEDSNLASLNYTINTKYPPGCVATSLGQMMAIMLKEKYPQYAAIVNSRKNLPSYGIPWIDYIDFVEGQPVIQTALFTAIPIKDTNYEWGIMPGSHIGTGNFDDNSETVKKTIAPLLRDIGLTIGVHYRLDTADGDYAPTIVRQYSGAATMKSFGFKHAASIGNTVLTVNNILARRKYFSYEVERIIQTNLDYGHPVQIDGTGHSLIIQAYGLENGSDTNILKDISARRKSKIVYETNDSKYVWSTRNELFVDPLARVLYNVFPETPETAKILITDGLSPAIISGRVVLPEHSISKNEL
jgi:hypothetical protein